MAPSCFKVFCSSRTTLQQLLLLTTQSRLCCTMGYYRRLRGRRLPEKSSVRAASLQHCSEVPTECFALWVETTLVFHCFLSAPHQMWHSFSFTKSQLHLKRRGGRGEEGWWWCLFPFWRLVWLISALLQGWQLRLGWVCREAEGKEAEDWRRNTEQWQIAREKQNMCLRVSVIGHCSSLSA